VLAAGSPIHVRKLRPDGTEAFAWDGTVLRCDDAGIVLRATFNLLLVDLGFTTFRHGDLFVEFYYWDRWYNVFQVSAPDGSLKGWYSNVGAPAQLDPLARELRYVDLARDGWMDPDGSYRVLDEDEFAACTTDRSCPPELVAGAERGRAELLALVRTGRLPHWPDLDQRPGHGN
jgi:protein associated with RNAse G/E